MDTRHFLALMSGKSAAAAPSQYPLCARHAGATATATAGHRRASGVAEMSVRARTIASGTTSGAISAALVRLRQLASLSSYSLVPPSLPFTPSSSLAPLAHPPPSHHPPSHHPPSHPPSCPPSRPLPPPLTHTLSSLRPSLHTPLPPPRRHSQHGAAAPATTNLPSARSRGSAGGTSSTTPRTSLC